MPKVAADRGTAIHTEAELYVTGKGSFTHNLRHFKDDLDALVRLHKAGAVVCEEEWGFATDWSIAPWKGAWLRMKCDVVVFMSDTQVTVIDYKTGRRFGNEMKHALQLQLYALAVLLRYPNIEEVTAELWYLDQNELASFVMHRKQIARYMQIFTEAGMSVTGETEFRANPNSISCKWCPYAPHNQNQCEFGINPATLGGNDEKGIGVKASRDEPLPSSGGEGTQWALPPLPTGAKATGRKKPAK